MQVFISWSGERSRQVALALRTWLPNVLQSVEPFVSSEDIEKGARWSTDIGRRLDDSGFGIVCVTPENATAPWLNFEAGALAKRFDSALVTPFLFDLAPTDVVGPLAQFQATSPNLGDVVRLLRSLNATDERPLNDLRVERAANLWWPQLESALQLIPESAQAADSSSRPEADILSEVLELARSTQLRLSRLEDGVRTRLTPSFDIGQVAFNLDPAATLPPGTQAHRAALLDRSTKVLIQEGVPFESIRADTNGEIVISLQEPVPMRRRLEITGRLLDVGASAVRFVPTRADRVPPE